jgi:hypothetical protein
MQAAIPGELASAKTQKEIGVAQHITGDSRNHRIALKQRIVALDSRRKTAQRPFNSSILIGNRRRAVFSLRQ